MGRIKDEFIRVEFSVFSCIVLNKPPPSPPQKKKGKKRKLKLFVPKYMMSFVRECLPREVWKVICCGIQPAIVVVVLAEKGAGVWWEEGLAAPAALSSVSTKNTE